MLQVEGLAKRYGDVLALQDLTVSVEAGQCLVLLGRNGAGKTTALRCMAGVLLPSGGMVKVDGIDAADDPAAVRARVGLMPEVPGLYERMSVRAYLDYFGAIYDIEPGVRRSRIDELLEIFELTDAGDRWLGTFSKGMRQKVALIRATLHRPRLVLADELTSALDPDSARRAWIYLKDLQRKGSALVILHPQHGRGRAPCWRHRDHVRRPRACDRQRGRAAPTLRFEDAPRGARAADAAGHLPRDCGQPS